MVNDVDCSFNVALSDLDQAFGKESGISGLYSELKRLDGSIKSLWKDVSVVNGAEAVKPLDRIRICTNLLAEKTNLLKGKVEEAGAKQDKDQLKRTILAIDIACKEIPYLQSQFKKNETQLATEKAKDLENNKFEKMYQAQKSIQESGLKKEEFVKIMQFAKGVFAKSKSENTERFFKEDTKLNRTISVQPSNKHVIIHLKEKGGKQLRGKGSFKKVYEALVIWNGEKAERMADLTFVNYTHEAKREIEKAKEFQSPHVAKSGIFLTNYKKKKTNEERFSCIEELYDSDWEKAHKLTFKEKVKLFLGAAKGLKHIHDKGWVHRDIKPANLAIKKGEAVVIDLGLAERMNSPLAKQLAGTMMYMSPNRISKLGAQGTHTAKDDIWALGLSAYNIFFTPSNSPQQVNPPFLRNILSQFPFFGFMGMGLDELTKLTQAKVEKDLFANKPFSLALAATKDQKELESIMKQCLQVDAKNMINDGALVDRLQKLYDRLP